jgi:hypothetical protein
MERRRSSGLGIAAVVAAVVVVAGAVWFLRSAGSDYERSPIEVGPTPGARVYVETGDEIDAGSLGHPDHPEAAWTVAGIDESVVEVLRSNHEPRGTGIPDAEFLGLMSPVMQDLWTDVPDPDRPPDVVPDNEDEEPFWLWPFSTFGFAGRALGESEVTLELWVEGELIDTFGFTVTVVEDACDYFEGQESMVKVPHRCG